MKRELVELFRVPEEQIVVIPNAVNKREIQEGTAAPVTCPWNSDIPVVITAGRLTLQKGQWHLIRAFAEVRKRIPCQLAILGSGELEDYLRGMAKELGVERDVFFLGWQKNPYKFMTRADLFVLPSLTEGFGFSAAGGDGMRLAGHCDRLSRRAERSHSAGNDWTSRADAIIRILHDKEMSTRYVAAGLVRVRDFDHALFLDRYQRLIEKT